MILDCSKYVGPCKCGRTHTLETEKVVVEYGATANFEQYMADVGLADKRRVVVYDSNIYELTQGKHVKADQEIVLPAQGLRSEDIIIEKMMEDLDNRQISRLQTGHPLRGHPHPGKLRRFHRQHLLRNHRRPEEVHPHEGSHSGGG